MTMLVTPQPDPQQPLHHWAVFALGFRPFFLLAGLSAVLLLAHWLLILAGKSSNASDYFDPLVWHSHELLFGYAAAVIGGFLLTAVQNWTGISTPRGLSLSLLVLLWLAGRVVIHLPTEFLSGWFIAGIDWAFLPLIAVIIGRRIWIQQQKNNYQFVALLVGLSIVNLLIHLQTLGVIEIDIQAALFAALYLVILLLIMLGGRVIPFFTKAILPDVITQKWLWVEWLAPLSMAALATVTLVQPWGLLAALLAALACVVNAVRLWGWQPWRTFQTPMLWVLHLGYGWLVLGLGMSTAAYWLPILTMPAAHALTIGALGGLTLGMMARVALGHTGRPIEAAPITIAAFVLIHLAAAVRVFLPLLMPSYYPMILMLAGIFWLLAFLLFLFHYTPILLQSRVDGREG